MKADTDSDCDTDAESEKGIFLRSTFPNTNKKDASTKRLFNRTILP